MKSNAYLQEGFWVNEGPAYELTNEMESDDTFLKITVSYPLPCCTEFYDYFWDKDYRSFACCMKYFHIRRKIMYLLEDEHNIQVEDTDETKFDVVLEKCMDAIEDKAVFEKYLNLWHSFDYLIESETVTKDEFVKACENVQNIIQELPGYDLFAEVYDGIEELGKSFHSSDFKLYKTYFTKENFSEDAVYEFFGIL